MASIKGNILLNITNTVVGFLFPLVTFPYVSRILMPEGIGIVQFYQSIINYIVLLSALGIPLYAVREIARLRDDVAIRNKVTLEIFILHAILSVIGYLVVFLLCVTVSKIRSDWPLFFLLSTSILLNVLGVYWFYQAMEEFKYITIRSLIVKFLTAIGLFTLVRSKNDLYTYAAILVCSEAGNYLLNFIRLRRYIKITHCSLRNLQISRHLLPAFKIFLLNFAISMYVNLNPIMLGFMADDAAVGYYAAVIRILKAGNGIAIALGNVILPRMSNYFASGKNDEFKLLKKKTLDIIVLLCLPMSICTVILAPVLMPVFSGKDYLPAILTLQLSSPTLLLSALNYIVAIQILYSQGRENIVIIATGIGALVNIIVNALLMAQMQQNGTAIASCLAELSVLITCCTTGKSYIGYNFINRNNILALVAGCICGFAVWSIGKFSSMSDIIMLISQFTTAVFVYAISLHFLKNELFNSYYHAFINKVFSLFHFNKLS